jgi:uncharacterized membrane protein (DUF2068 family)
MNFGTSPKGKHLGLRGIAMFEAGKGLLAFAVAIWMFTLMHRDKVGLAERVLDALHISPDRHFYHRAMHFAENVTNRNLWLFIFGILGYTAIRFVEAYGLWMERLWAEWFALISGSLYIPLEIYELTRRPNLVRWGILAINVAIVLYLAWFRFTQHRVRKRVLEAPG